MAGVGWQVWRPPGGMPASGGGEGAGAGLWAQTFEQPAGGRLEMSALRGRPLLLNFWATWCPPCVREMPLLDSFYRQQRSNGWQVVGLALDSAGPVQDFLRRIPVAFPIGIGGAGGMSLVRSLGNAGGQLPFTVVFDRQGSVQQRKLGIVEAADLARWGAQPG